MAIAEEPITFCVEKGLLYTSTLQDVNSVLKGTVPNMMLQIAVIVIISRAIHHLILRRLYQPLLISQLITGVLLHNIQFKKFQIDMMFMGNTSFIQDTLTMTGLGIFLFVVGVKIDLSMLRNSGKKAVVIGVICTVIPLVAVTLLAKLAHRWEPESIKPFHPTSQLGRTWCVTSYLSVSIFLNEYNLLNSKLGRLALSSSLIGELILTVVNSIITSFTNLKTSTDMLTAVSPFLSMVAFAALVMFVARPITKWIVKRTPEGQQLSENHFAIVLLLALSCGLFSIIIRQYIYVGMFLFGLVLPSGPPLGTTLANRLELHVRELYVPIFMASIGLGFHIDRGINKNEALYLSFLLLLSILGKMIGVILPALCYKISFFDSLILAFIMCIKGFYELELLAQWQFDFNFTFTAYGVLFIAIMMIAGVGSALIKLMYNPSSRHIAYKRRTIEHAKSGQELRILACVHKQENVPPIINLLKASHPTRESPLNVHLLHLIELVGSTASVLLPYKNNKGSTSMPTESDRIVNAFRIFERQSLSCVQLEPFTSICPYSSIHDDICSLALDTKASFLILPFHRPITLDGTLEPMNLAFQAININVLGYAPCSIGILITHGSSHAIQTNYKVAVYFLGGPDDREALALATRMARNPHVTLTVVRFLLPENWRDKWEEKLDEETLSEFKFDTMSNNRVLYREEAVNDGEEMVNIITRMSKEFSLVMVGRRKELDMQMSSSFSMWSEYPELGIIGDIFASADTGTNVCTLVVQRHARVGQIKMADIKF